MDKVGLFPGSFNSLHSGHIEIIKKSLKIFDKLYLVIAKNSNKKNNIEKNYNNVNEKLKEYNFKNLEVIKTNKKIPIIFKELKCSHIVRGVRDLKDLKYEIELIDSYKKINKDINELIFIADKEYRKISSSNRNLFAFDIDGTLLTDEKKILPSTKLAIKKLIKNGNEVILCTGRHYLASLDIIKELNIENYVISSNGSTIYNIKNNKIRITKSFLNKKDIDIAIGLAQKYKRELIWNNCKKIYRVYFGNDPLKEINDYKYFIGGSEKNPKYDNWDKVKNTIYDNIIQISIKVESNIIKNEIKKIKNKVTKNCICVETSEVYIDFLHKDINKFNSIKKLIKEINIKSKNVYVFGDSENDFLMVSKFENGVAMGNARKILKDNSKYIIGNNNSDSIYNFLLEKEFINE